MKLACTTIITLCAAWMATMATAAAEPATRGHLARDDQGFVQFSRSAIAPAVVRSRSDLDSYLSYHPDSAIQALSDGGRDAFLNSLVFTEKGLGSFNFRVLEDELTPTQIHEVLSLFGLGALVPHFKGARVETENDERLLSLDTASQDGRESPCPIIENAECSPPATCRSDIFAWCITCNCGMKIP